MPLHDPASMDHPPVPLPPVVPLSDRMDPMSRQIERRSDGAVLVRVPSRAREGHSIPDAVFAFRLGDPQYRYWEERLREQERSGK
jgi:hypothetical protein